MKSSIKVDFIDNGNGLQPVIAIRLEDSEDVRDSLLKTFFQVLGGQSSWLSVSFDHYITNDEGVSRTFISIHPIPPSELNETLQIIKKRVDTDNYSVTNCNPLDKSKNVNV